MEGDRRFPQSAYYLTGGFIVTVFGIGSVAGVLKADVDRLQTDHEKWRELVYAIPEIQEKVRYISNRQDNMLETQRDIKKLLESIERGRRHGTD